MAVTDEAIAQIKAMIVSGELRPGDRLPPEKELAERLGLSRSSMREAVKALEVIRVLDVRRGDGTYVTSLEPALLLEAISFINDMNDESLLEILAVRRLLESHATAVAAREATPDQVAELEAELESVAPDTDVATLVEHDARLHGRIMSLTGNRYLTSLVESLSGQTVRARIWRGLTEAGAVERTLDEHRAIVAAIAAGDAELAHALATAHVSGVENWLRTAASVRHGRH